ncbi:MAG TPA: methylmalonyl-CoA mutase family protein, partial [Thermoflexales bacterium]|nr:methylmalonyl-CoA mutase family protein [Thermoflexales bacterium]
MSNHDVEQNELREKFEAWERNELAAFLARSPERKEQFATESGIPLKRVYTALDAPDDADIGLPGQFPFTRGPYPTM